MSRKLFIQYPRCGTCQKANKWLKSNNIDFEDRDITVANPTKEELKSWIMQSSLPITKFFNTSGKIYKEQNLKDKVKSATEDELLDILASNGMVVKRPLLIDGQTVLVGFNEEVWAQALCDK